MGVVGRCPTCYRLTWDEDEIGRPCGRITDRHLSRCPDIMERA